VYESLAHGGHPWPPDRGRAELHITWAYAQGSLPQVIEKVNWPVKGGKDHIFTFAGFIEI
jgi:hypothetical protein